MLKIKTLITSALCSLIISDSVAVEIIAIGQPCAKIFRKVRCATFLRHGVLWLNDALRAYRKSHMRNRLVPK